MCGVVSAVRAATSLGESIAKSGPSPAVAEPPSGAGKEWSAGKMTGGFFLALLAAAVLDAKGLAGSSPTGNGTRGYECQERKTSAKASAANRWY